MMAVAFYIDEHVPRAIAYQLRLRGVDVLTVQEDGREQAADEQLLVRALELNRVLFTQDIRFRVRAEDWQRSGRQFSGLAFGPQLGGTIGQYVEDLAVIAECTHPEEWRNLVVYLPFAT